MYKFAIATKLDERTYAAFARFNTFRAFNHFIGYIIFPAAMLLFAIINLREGSIPFFCICLLLALFSTLYHTVFYSAILRRQLRRLNLSAEKTVYTVCFTEENFHIENDTEQADYTWSNIHTVYKTKDVIYLYMLKTKCFILPAKDILDGKTIDELWAFLQTKLQKYQLKQRT